MHCVLRPLLVAWAAFSLTPLSAAKPVSESDPRPAPADMATTVPRPYVAASVFKGIKRRSYYLTMRDGVRVAVDVLLPATARGQRLPAVLQQTRYWRTPDIRFPFSLFKSPLDLQGIFGRFKHELLAAGYVWVDVTPAAAVHRSGAGPGIILLTKSRTAAR